MGPLLRMDSFLFPVVDNHGQRDVDENVYSMGRPKTSEREDLRERYDDEWFTLTGYSGHRAHVDAARAPWAQGWLLTRLADNPWRVVQEQVAGNPPRRQIRWRSWPGRISKWCCRQSCITPPHRRVLCEGCRHTPHTICDGS